MAPADTEIQQWLASTMGLLGATWLSEWSTEIAQHHARTTLSSDKRGRKALRPFCTALDIMVIGLAWWAVVHFDSFAGFLLLGLSPAAWAR